MLIRALRATVKVPLNAPVRMLVTLTEYKYTAHATARGQGRNGQVESPDGPGLKLRLAMPKALGGKEDGPNPEQLFAMGYSACLLGAVQLMARKQGKQKMAENAVVHASVHIGKPENMDGLGLAVDMKVEGVDDEVLRAGHEACPYSRALQHGVVVNVSRA